jgi:hypothetical protein
LMCCCVWASQCSFAKADAPTAIYLFPAGGQRGMTTEVRIGGCDLHDGCPFEMTGVGVSTGARTKPAAKTIWFEGPVIPLPDSQAKETYPSDHIVDVTIARDAPFGFRKARLSNSQGLSESLKFVIGDLPEIVEQEVDGAPIPTAVQLPITINGRTFPREDVDVWTFEGKAGVSYACEVMAARFGSPLDSHLVVRGPNNVDIADSDDFFGSDSYLRFTAPEDGIYHVSIHDMNFGGLQDYVYRLSITGGPHIESVFPLGGRRGTSVPMRFTGQLVPGDSVFLEMPSTSESTFIHQFAFGGTSSKPVLLELGDLPEVIESEPNDLTTVSNTDETNTSEPLQLPLVLNGRIARAGEIDTWRVSLVKDQLVDFEVHAAQLGSRLNSVVSVLDATGKELAGNDDSANGQSDSKLVFKAPSDGVYQVKIHDRFGNRGGQAFAYRLKVQPTATEPDFELLLPSEVLNLQRGREVKFKVSAARRQGLTGPIALSFDGLPEGVTVQGDSIPDKKNDVTLVFKAAETASITRSSVTIVGSAKVGEQELTHKAVLPPAAIDDTEIDHLKLAVTVPTPFKIFGKFETKYAARGSTFVRQFSIDRGGFEGPITVRLAERQVRHLQGVTGPTIVVPPGVNEFEYPAHLPPWMEIGRTSRTCLMGVGDIQDPDGTMHRVSFTSQEQFDQIIVLVDPGQLDIHLDRTSIQDSSNAPARVKVTVSRGQRLTGAVKIELISPDHMRCVSASAITVPPEQQNGVLELKFTSGTLSPFNMPLTIRATANVDGHPYTAEEKITIVN